jgi:hypothetical protein
MLLLTWVAALAADQVFLTVAYCPTPFKGEGAVVKVNAGTGAFDVQHRFHIHDDIGCPMDVDTVFAADARNHAAPPPYNGRSTHISYTGDAKYSIVSNDKDPSEFDGKGKSDDAFVFTGFTSFDISQASKARKYTGLTPHATLDGFCKHGCLRLGHQDIASGVFSGLGPLPFKAVSTGTRFLHEAASTYYAQGSYPLTTEAFCGATNYSKCLYAINSTTGEFISAKETPDFVVYKF